MILYSPFLKLVTHVLKCKWGWAVSANPHQHSRRRTTACVWVWKVNVLRSAHQRKNACSVLCKPSFWALRYSMTRSLLTAAPSRIVFFVWWRKKMICIQCDLEQHDLLSIDCIRTSKESILTYHHMRCVVDSWLITCHRGDHLPWCHVTCCPEFQTGQFGAPYKPAVRMPGQTGLRFLLLILKVRDGNTHSGFNHIILFHFSDPVFTSIPPYVSMFDTLHI